MSKELRDLIESIDTANQAHSDLLTVIRYLKEEVQRLNFKINEQQRIIKTQGVKISKFDTLDVPEDLAILKDMVTNQREEINKKDEHIRILENSIEELTKTLEQSGNEISSKEGLTQSNEVITQLRKNNKIELFVIKVTIGYGGLFVYLPH